ncbi:hypothetical protein H1C71_015121 [Ictidomys tridecemlineatus]|nr:hypothetical protein H1C71_015121 [Ictidomys tridecemlineatus]KAG3260263.1 hypothetical protein H1C71_015121 [Ictidomys tridecemlineatus]
MARAPRRHLRPQRKWIGGVLQPPRVAAIAGVTGEGGTETLRGPSSCGSISVSTSHWPDLPGSPGDGTAMRKTGGGVGRDVLDGARHTSPAPSCQSQGSCPLLWTDWFPVLSIPRFLLSEEMMLISV